MKNDSNRAHAWAAEVEVAKVMFDKGVDLGIEFKNQIDAWNRMEFKFRSTRWGSTSGARYARKDLYPLVYALRERLE